MAKQTKEKEPQKKYKESEVLVIKRSQINFAPYNPKNHSKKQVEEQKANIKRVGFLGGIIWNKTTSNLIDGHKRIMSLDILNGYDGTPETDYDVRVEMIELDEKTEREQNIFQTKNRTELDDELMRQLIPDIDYKNAGLNELDMSYYGMDLNPEMSNATVNEIEDFYRPEKEEKATNPSNTIYHSNDAGINENGEPRFIQEHKPELTAEEKKQNVKDVKEATMQKAIEKTQNMDAYFMVSFESWEAKRNFMIRAKLDPNTKMIVGEEFASSIEFL